MSHGDQLRPPGRHMGQIGELRDDDRNPAFECTVRAQEVEIRHKQRDKGDRAFFRSKSVSRPIVAFKRPVESLDDLFDRAELLGHRILIGQSDHLADVKRNPVLGKKVLRQQVNGIAVDDERQIVRDGRQLSQDVIDGADGRQRIPVGRDAIRQHHFFHGIKHKKQVMPASFHANIRLVPTERAGQLVREPVDKRLNHERDAIGVVEHRLMGDRHAMHILHDSGCLSGGHPIVNVVRQHESEGVRRHRQTRQIDLWLFRRRWGQRWKVKQKLTEQIPHLEGLRVLLELLAFLLAHPAKVLLVKWAVVVLALVDVVVLAFFDFLKRLEAVRATKDRLLFEPISMVEPALAHFALVLPFSAVVGVQVG